MFIPLSLYSNRELIINAIKPYLKAIHLYLVFHDCGKPFCRSLDKDGQHFYNHENISETVFKSIFDNNLARELIKKDMLFHRSNSSTISEFKKQSHYLILTLAAIAEFNANCELFGGKDSTNYKIKKKQIEAKLRSLFKA